MNYDIPPLSQSAKDKHFVRIHRIRKLESKIVALVGVMFSCTTLEAKKEAIEQLRQMNDELSELESE